MDRTIFWSQNQSRTFDYVEDDHDALLAFALLSQDILGPDALVSGFTATASNPATLSFTLGAGRLYQTADADATAIGAIPQDLTQILQQGIADAEQTITLAPPTTSGQSQWNLIQAQFSQSDVVRTNDPNNGLLYFYNSSNPQQPYQGPGNNGQITPTVRKGIVTIQVVQGSPATTGSEVPPQPTSGWIPLFLVDLAYGQTQIVQSQILQAGPSVGTNVPSNYPATPLLTFFLADLGAQIIPVLEAAGLTPDRTNPEQLLTAIQGWAGKNIAVFYNSGTWTVPNGVTTAEVEIVGGGGGGGGSSSTYAGGGGGAGGFAKGPVDNLTPGSQITVTVGAGGAGGTSPAGSAGGSSSFGSYGSASGGGGAADLTSTNTGGGGTGGNGQGLALTGQGGNGSPGTPGALTFGGIGGSTVYGGGGAPSTTGTSASNATSFGAGGGGAFQNVSTTGGNGFQGIVIVRW